LSNTRMKQLEGKLYGLKTPCCHCFHMTCLSHWASLSIVKKEVKKPAKQWETDRDDIAMKSMEGQIKSTEAEIASLNEQKEKLKSDIIDSETELKTALLEIQKIVDREKEMEDLADAEADKPMSTKNKNNANIHSKNRKTNLICNVKDTEMAALKVTIKNLRSKLSLLVTEGAKRKNSNERREASEEVISLRECLSKTEQQLDDVKHREGRSMCYHSRRVVIHGSGSLMRYAWLRVFVCSFVCVCVCVCVYVEGEG
jgi:chromosome segregation ATPase